KIQKAILEEYEKVKSEEIATERKTEE
ncbi:MAG TPA: septation protein SpoVG, partial [Clostridium sp.]|nr:septation protein SpoVG [Clostridium sp.]